VWEKCGEGVGKVWGSKGEMRHHCKQTSFHKKSGSGFFGLGSDPFSHDEFHQFRLQSIGISMTQGRGESGGGGCHGRLGGDWRRVAAPAPYTRGPTPRSASWKISFERRHQQAASVPPGECRTWVQTASILPAPVAPVRLGAHVEARVEARMDARMGFVPKKLAPRPPTAEPTSTTTPTPTPTPPDLRTGKPFAALFGSDVAKGLGDVLGLRGLSSGRSVSCSGVGSGSGFGSGMDSSLKENMSGISETSPTPSQTLPALPCLVSVEEAQEMRALAKTRTGGVWRPGMYGPCGAIGAGVLDVTYDDDADDDAILGFFPDIWSRLFLDEC
jgi:hypothetical protein